MDQDLDADQAKYFTGANQARKRKYLKSDKLALGFWLACQQEA